MSSDTLAPAPRSGFSPAQYAICLNGIVWRETLRFLHQRERFIAALVRPLVWLFIFAAGFRQVLGVSIIPPYEVYVLYGVYITPGLVAMIQLFNGMQSSLSMVYDREMGNMRTLLVSPLPRWYLLSAKLVAGTSVSLLQVYTFLAIAWLWDIEPPLIGYLTVLPALILSGLMLGALGMLLSSVIHARRGAHSLCPIRPAQRDFARRRLWMHSAVHGRRDPSLRSISGLLGTPRWARGNGMTPSSFIHRGTHHA
jgi:ABC-2 type transport system permease protein